MVLVKILTTLVGWMFFALVAPILFSIAYGIILLPWALILLLKKRRQISKTPTKTWSSNKEQVVLENKRLSCSHCGEGRFSKREGLLVTSWAAFFFYFTWFSQSATCYECLNCGFISWFSSPKESEFSAPSTVEENKIIEAEIIHK